nr:POLO box duplicated region [Vulcanococcus limneticus]
MSILLSALRLVGAAVLHLRRAVTLYPGLPIVVCLALALAPTAAPALAADAAWLESRLASWPDWSLPAPLPRPGHSDLTYPAWFAGTWRAQSHALSGPEPDLSYLVRFRTDRRGAVVGDRAFNAAAIGQALLGEQLQGVRNDPHNPNRQLAQLTGDRQLESSVIGRRSAAPGAGGQTGAGASHAAAAGSTAREPAGVFLADELTLQILHGPGDPRVSRVETLSRYLSLGPGQIEAEQWQTSYGSPAEGLTASARHPWHGRLVLERLADDSADGAPDPSSVLQPAQGRPTSAPMRSRQANRGSS